MDASGLHSSMHTPDDQMIVGRVRVRARAGIDPVDPTTARGRLRQILAAVSAESAGLSPSAVLCIRELRDPLPGALRVDASGQPSNAWLRAMQRAIEEAARSAARPLDGSVPSAATAVLFRDRAELLACLARDWVRGASLAQWWWRYLIPDRVRTRSAPSMWSAEPQYVPAALRLLAARGDVVSFASALTEAESLTLFVHVTRAFGLDVPLSAIAREGSPFARAPWEPWAPEARDERLNAMARAFVGVGLVLARALPTARTRSFTTDVARWLAPAVVPVHANAVARGESGHAAAPIVPPIAEPPRVFAVRPRLDETPLQSEPRDDLDAKLHEPPNTTTRSDSRAERQLFEAESPQALAASAEAIPSNEIARSDPPAALSENGHSRPDAEPAEARRPSPLDPDAPSNATAASYDAWLESLLDEPRPTSTRARASEPDPSVESERVHTRYGGVLFLVNVLLALDMYGDFTQPLSRFLEPSPWRVLALLARKLLGPSIEEADAIWSLLDRLANEPDDYAASWPHEWRLEPAHLDPFHPGDDLPSAWTSSVVDQRLRIEHPAGFVVLDVPLDEDVRSAASRELERYGSPAVNEGESRFPSPATFLDLLAVFVRAHVGRLLDADDASKAVHLLLEREACVHVTAAHVDVEMRLQDLPIEVRLAGLDRDPGWVPAAGRFIAFHFEV